MIDIILVLLIVGLVTVVVLVLRQPDEFRTTRTAVIAAPPEAIFPHVNDLHKWQAWSPWAKMDPDAKTVFEGPVAGVGALMRWNGRKTGQGSMEIMQSHPAAFVQFRLVFLKPMQATNMAEFTFTPQGDATEVSWTMHGPNSLMGKIMGLVINCERMVGGQFEQGLESLKTIVEG